MHRPRVLAVAAMAVLLLSVGTASAGPGEGKGGRETESVVPGAMPKERARIMGYGADDPRAAADARRNLGGNNKAADNEAKIRKEDRRKAKAAGKQR